VTNLARAALATGERPSLWIVALCGFLARGGIILLALPITPLPSTVGLATFVGPTSVTAAGLTPDGVARLVLVGSLAITWLLAGSTIGTLTDIALVAGFGPRADIPALPPGRQRVARLIGLRLVALLPLLAVVAITARPVGELVYHELILPRDVAAPLLLRVVQGAQVQVACLILAWVAGEVLGGIAVRLVILEDRSFARAIAGSVTHVVRHPLPTLVATVAGLIVLVAGVAPALLATGLAWTSLADALSGMADGSAVVRSTILLVGAWVGCATLAAIAAAWRGALWTAEVAMVRGPGLNPA
jgi:hypothetical protein